MLIRRCAQGHDVQIYRNTHPDSTLTQTYQDGTVVTLSYPSPAKDYFVMADGAMTKRTDSFETAENEFISICETKHSTSNGHIDWVKHKLDNHKVVNR